VPFNATADSEACAETADCSARAERCADCEFAVIIAGLTANGFFIQRSRCCAHNEIEYSVKILHAVRSAITATAELLVSTCTL